MLLYVAAIEKELWTTGTVNEEYLKALNALFNNFPRLRATEPATLSLPHLVTALKTGLEATQEAALEHFSFPNKLGRHALLKHQKLSLLLPQMQSPCYST